MWAGRGYARADTATHESLIQAGEFVRAMEAAQGLRIGCVEEAAFRNGRITAAELQEIGAAFPDGPYYQYLERLAREAGAEGSAEDGAAENIVGLPS